MRALWTNAPAAVDNETGTQGNGTREEVVDLQDVLSRRSDLSTFLVHFCREYDGVSARGCLESILAARKIEARNVFGQAQQRQGELTEKAAEAQRVVCFSETPIEHAHLMIQEIEGRNCNFGPYGIAITKVTGRLFGVNPVWYADNSYREEFGPRDWLTKPLNRLVDRYINTGCSDSDLAAIFPFFEQMGTGDNGKGSKWRKEFWWEREWRLVGDYPLNWIEPPGFICLCPEGDFQYFREVLDANGHKGVRCIDPTWSLEQIICSLSGMRADLARV